MLCYNFGESIHEHILSTYLHDPLISLLTFVCFCVLGQILEGLLLAVSKNLLGS